MAVDISQTLAQFVDAVREKNDWVRKILDEDRGLAQKWAIEAGLLSVGDDYDDESLPVVPVLRYATL